MGKYDSPPRANYRNKTSAFDFLRMAEIIRVDYFRRQCDIRFMDSVSFAVNVPFVAPIMGANSGMSGMPTNGSIALVGYIRHADNLGHPVILGFLPRNIIFGYSFEPYNLRDEITDEEEVVKIQERIKHWKTYPGEQLISSSEGSDIRVDKGIFLQNSMMNEVYLDPFTQVISMLSLNQTFNSKAGHMNFGLIHRNDLLNSTEWRTKFTPAAQPLADGRLIYRVTNAPKSSNFPYGSVAGLHENSAQGFTEFRIDLRELADDNLDVTEESTGFKDNHTTISDGSPDDAIIEHPMVSFVVGTLVGNDSITFSGQQDYGKVLMPQTFAGANDDTIVARDVAVDQGNGINGERKQAGAFQVKLPNTLTSFNFTKEGVLEFSLDKSSASHPLGADRSANIGLQGSLKMRIGKQAYDGKSLLLQLDGGADIKIGSEATKQRSMNVILTNSINLEVLGSDTDKNAFRARYKGNIDMYVDGDRTTEITGNEVIVVHGKLEHRVLGKKVDNYVNDQNQNYGGNLSRNIVQNYQTNIGAGRDVTIAAPNLTAGETTADKQKIILGDKELEMLLGDNDIKMLAGDYTDSILLGDRSFEIGLGDFDVSVKLGDISLETLVGDVSLSTLAGQISLSALQITLKALQVKIDAPLVSIGNLPQGGVVNNGPAGHKDYMTGLPLLASVSVTCNSI